MLISREKRVMNNFFNKKKTLEAENLIYVFKHGDLCLCFNVMQKWNNWNIIQQMK